MPCSDGSRKKGPSIDDSDGGRERKQNGALDKRGPLQRRIDERDLGRPKGRPCFDLTPLLAELGGERSYLPHPPFFVEPLQVHALRD
jgi:hypothetical protein